MMPERIDHVIVAAADLDQLEAAFTRLGFRVVGGGQHPHLGTRNRIILLGEGYIELLAISDEQVVSTAVRERIMTAPGWIGFALQTSGIAAEADEMRMRGADARGPRPGRLVAPGGSARSWQTVTVGGDDLFSVAEPIPFLIQHDSSGEHHQRELAGADANTMEPHPNGALRLQSVVVAVNDLSNAARVFGQAYGLSPFGAPTQDSELYSATFVALPLSGVDEQLLLAQPTGAGIVRDRLARAGEGVCSVVVAVDDVAATRGYLEAAGVTFEQWPIDLLFIPAETTGGAPLLFARVADEES
jgi:glyoxalase-like protein